MSPRSKPSPPTILIPTPTRLRLSSLKPDVYNPRVIADAEFEALKASIRDNGFVENLVIRKRGLGIIAGHQRHRALRELVPGSTFVPCVVLDVDDRRARKLNIALNKLGGAFDDELLAKAFKALDEEAPLTDAELLAVGFGRDDVDLLVETYCSAPVEQPAPDGADDLGEFARSVTLSLQFDSVVDRDWVKAQLERVREGDGRKSGAVVLEALQAFFGAPAAPKGRRRPGVGKAATA